MMKQGLYKIFFLTLIAGIIAIGMTSCEKFNEWEVDGTANKLFRPSELTATVTGVSVVLKWKAKPNTNSYTIELSKDSLLFTTIDKTYTFPAASVIKDVNGNLTFAVPELLDASKQYSARIKGVDSTGVTPPSEWAAVAFLTKTEQILNAVASTDLTINSVKLSWVIPNQVTHFMLGGVRYDITADEKLTGKKTITGLTPATVYTADLYLNASLRGTQAFATPTDLPTGLDVVYVKATDNLAAMIEAATANTRFVVLAGTKYDAIYDATNSSYKVLNVPSNINISIIGQASATNKSIISFNGMNLPAVGGKIHFENVDLTGFQNGDETTSKRAYIFNQSTASTTAKISFENCIIHHFTNAVVRMQGTNTIAVDSIVVNNCIVDDISSASTYSFIHNSVATSKINNIIITNSSFSGIGYSVILHGSAPSLSVKVENNTFYNVVGPARYLIDYNAQTIANGFSFKNNIIGKVYNATARGIRSGTAATGSNNYTTTDALFVSNVIPTSILANPNYTKTSDDLFTSPATGNFLIKDTGFDGRATTGDPRWRIQ